MKIKNQIARRKGLKAIARIRGLNISTEEKTMLLQHAYTRDVIFRTNK